MISAAFAADKRQLLRGEPTVITAEARESYERLAERVLKRALGRGETVTLEAVKLRIVQRKPEARPYLLPEVSRGRGSNPFSLPASFNPSRHKFPNKRAARSSPAVTSKRALRACALPVDAGQKRR